MQQKKQEALQTLTGSMQNNIQIDNKQLVMVKALYFLERFLNISYEPKYTRWQL